MQAPLEIGHGVRVSRQQVLDSPVYQDWAARVEGWQITQITLHNVVATPSGKILIIQMSVRMGSINYAVMLRGASVDVLTILVCEGRRYVVHVSQTRVAVGERDQWSNVAGFVDLKENPDDAASREALEELGVELPPGEIIDLNGCALQTDGGTQSMNVSAGAVDERVYFFARTIEVTAEQLAGLQDAVAGLEAESEKTHVHITPLHKTVLEIVPMLGRVNDNPEVKSVTSILLYHTYIEQR